MSCRCCACPSPRPSVPAKLPRLHGLRSVSPAAAAALPLRLDEPRVVLRFLTGPPLRPPMRYSGPSPWGE